MSAEIQRFDIEVAFPCDIDLEWYLVPKAWVREIVQKIIVNHTVKLIKEACTIVTQSRTLKLEELCQNLIKVLHVNKHSVLQDVIEKIHERTKGIANFGIIFESTVGRPIKVIKNANASSLIELKKAHS
jgi:hypothetical protein